MKNNYFFDGIFGHILGDILGRPFEGKTRKYMEEHPLLDFPEEIDGIFTDDSSTVIGELDSLKDGYDLKDVMDKFVAWIYEGKYTPNNEAFGYGRTTKKSIDRYKEGMDPVHSGGIREYDNGNGSLMRILPFVFFHYSKEYRDDLDELFYHIYRESSLSHQHLKSKIACSIYALIVFSFLDNRLKDQGLDKKEIIERALSKAFNYYKDKEDVKNSFSAFSRIFKLDFSKIDRNEVKSGPFVIDSLEAVIFSLINSNSYKSGILEAINLGKDTDSQAAIAGGLLGIYYGLDDLEYGYLKNIRKFEKIERLIKINYDLYGGEI